MKKFALVFFAILCLLQLTFAQSTAPTSVTVKFETPYVQYLKLSIDPADQNKTSELIIQNTEKSLDLQFPDNTPVSISLLDFRGESDISLSVSEANAKTDLAKGLPLKFTTRKNLTIRVTLTPKAKPQDVPPVADAGPDLTLHLPANSATLDGSKSAASLGPIASYSWSQPSGPTTATLASPTAAKTTASSLTLGDYRFRLTVTDNSKSTSTDEIAISVKPPEQIDFKLLLPAEKSLVTTTRKPTLTWEPVPAATKYEIYLNTSRTDYDWYASGNLLDRYTKIADSPTNSFTLTDDLPDRWTYKWYVVASTPAGPKYSAKQQFGLYLPTLESEKDAINIVDNCRDLNKNGTIEPFEDWRLTPDARLDDLLPRLTTEEKAAQLFYGGNENPTDGFAFSYGVEGGMRTVQFAASKSRMGIPIAFLGDKIHGWKTIYPTQLGLAATRDVQLAWQCGNLHRIEQKSFGFTGTLAPLAEVNTKALYPRFQEGCGENADEAAAMLRAIICGMQGGPELNPHSMLITVKHWPSQGAGGEGQLQYDAVTIRYHMKPWLAAVDANAASAMPGYSGSKFLDPLRSANTSKKITDYLRNEIKFQGFVVTDWLAANTNQSVESLGAGIDVMGGSPSSKTDIKQLVEKISLERINESARRVLNVKIRLGMFENPYADPTCKYDKTDHQAIVLNAAKKSVTLIKNNGILPLKLASGDQLVVAGPRAKWPNKDQDPNVIWQSIYYDNPQAKTYIQAFTDRATPDGIKVSLDSAENPKVAVVILGEKSYTHGTEWPDKNPNFPADQLAIVKKFHDAGVKVITVIITPRPYVLTPLLENSDAILLVYRGGNGIATATASAVFGDFTPTGRLPFQLPKSDSQLGTDNPNNMLEKWDLPYDLGATDAQRSQIRAYIEKNQSVPSTFGDPLFPYGFGLQNFGKEK